MGDKVSEGRSYCNLGNAYDGLGDFRQAIEYHKRDMSISEELGNRAGVGRACGNLGNAYYGLGDFNKP